MFQFQTNQEFFAPYAQPAFIQMQQQQMQVNKRIKRNKFTPEEDLALKTLVAQFGEYNWERIASHMPNRNERQCHDRWIYYLSPNINNEPFTKEEDELLFKLVSQMGGMWVQISKKFNKRSDKQIKNRWNLLKKSYNSIKPEMMSQHQLPNANASLHKDLKTIQTAHIIRSVNRMVASSDAPQVHANIPAQQEQQKVELVAAAHTTNELFAPVAHTENWTHFFAHESVDFDIEESLCSFFD